MNVHEAATLLIRSAMSKRTTETLPGGVTAVTTDNFAEALAVIAAATAALASRMGYEQGDV